MGDYETLDIDFAAEGEQETPDEDFDQMFDELYNWVNDKVGEEMRKARAASRVNKTSVKRK